MGFYQFTEVQFVKSDLPTLWNFIASPRNLKLITPDSMGFDIITPNIAEKMYEGMIVAYKVSPVAGIKTTWVTEITKVKDLEYFVDEQRLGPYKLWHHEHFLKEVDGGVLMTDIVSYAPPMGLLGQVANALLIKGKLKQIFAYRKLKMDELF